MSRARLACLLLVVGLAAACTRDVAEPAVERRAPRRAVAVIGITFRNIGRPDMTSSAIVASSVEEFEARYARQASRASFDLTVPKNTNGTGDGTIELDFVSASAVSFFGNRYIDAVYRVRNAQRTDSVAFNTPRRNLTFVTVSTANTILDTPVLALDREDGTPAVPTLARELDPASAVVVEGGIVLKPVGPDVLQVLTEAEVAAIAAPPKVTNTFPYGFVVRRVGSTTTRTLPASPAPEQFDGMVTFGFHLPLQANPADNPSTVTMMLLALDDSDTRITQSLEEQTSGAQATLQARATSLNASQVRLLPGGTLPGWPSATTERICVVRTAGPASAPTATLVNATASFVSLLPNPYAANGSDVSLTSTIAATFSEPVSGIGPSSFLVRGLQSGQQFRNATYTNAGSVVTTPQGAFFAGEEIEVEITAGASCRAPWVGRLRVRTPTSSNASYDQRALINDGNSPYKVAFADLNNDGILDIAKANEDLDNVTVFIGTGTGAFTNRGSKPAGDEPRSIAAGDFNGDGNLDLVVANGAADALSVLLGNGDGTLRNAVSYSVGAEPVIVLAGDFNGDGILDLVCGNVRADNLSVLLGNGNGTFQPQRAVATEPDPRSIALGDVNNDGILDIAVVRAEPILVLTSAQRVQLFRGNGDGTFTQIASALPERNPLAVAMGDINRDGRVDIVTANNSSDVSVLFGLGNGLFLPAQTYSAGNRRPDWITIGDMNGDGRLDLVVASSAGRVDVLLATALATFPTFRETTLSGSFEPNFVTVGDLNRDGILDIGLGNRASNAFAVLIGQP